MSKWYSFKELKLARTPMLLDSETGLPDNHVITVVERVISVDNSELIQNNVRTDTVTLDLDAEYDDLNVIIIFTKPNDINVQVAYNGQPVHIPGSVMELTGSVAVSVVGLDAEGATRAVTKAAPDTFQVVASGAYTGKISQDDVDLLGQILQAVSDTETAITAAETATTAATNATSQATSAATSANQAASSAKSAASSANSAATKANAAAVDAQNAYDTLQPYMATVDSCANILHREVGPDAVVTADDSFPCKPVEMTVYGNTRQNLWVNPSGTNNGITATENEDGTIALSGTSTTSMATVQTKSYVLKPSTQYTFSVDKEIVGGNCGFIIVQKKSDGNVTGSDVVIGKNGIFSNTFTTPSNIALAMLQVYCNVQGTTVSGTYRVMLNEGSEAQPWCPPGLNSVGDDGSVKVVTAGKNLLNYNDTLIKSGYGAKNVDLDGVVTNVDTTSDQRSWVYANSDWKLQLPVGDYKLVFSVLVASNSFSSGYRIYDSFDKNILEVNRSFGEVGMISSDFSLSSSTDIGIIIKIHNAKVKVGVFRADDYTGEWEKYAGSTVPIDLQGHSLCSLPDGTRDELHIDGGGNVVLEKRVQTVQLDGDGTWIRFENPYTHYTSPWSEYGGLPSGYLSSGYFVDKLPASSVVANGLYSANANWNTAYLREPAFASDAAGVKTWMGANTPIVIMPLLEPKTISLGTITPPTMAAPNVTAYVADDTPAEIELDYVRDINIVVDRLEKKVADLVVTEATYV